MAPISRTPTRGSKCFFRGQNAYQGLPLGPQTGGLTKLANMTIVHYDHQKPFLDFLESAADVVIVGLGRFSEVSLRGLFCSLCVQDSCASFRYHLQGQKRCRTKVPVVFGVFWPEFCTENRSVEFSCFFPWETETTKN